MNLNPTRHFHLAVMMLALCAVLTVAPLASAQSSDPLPMPDNFPTLGQMADRGTRNASADLMATAAFANGGDASANILQEGGAPVEVNISLNAQPTTPVTLTYGLIGNVLVHPKQITFTPENWNIPQTVEIHAL
ncbi:MAG: hypothetical protein MUF38_07185, partial [Anaerolineae bacterium]|nr:hypothetical protein [Anaerolineae bacterium]